MSCCCNLILNLCDVNACSGELKTGVNAAVTGEFTLVTNFLGTEYRIKANILVGEEIKFPVDKLNENYTFTAQILDPTGAVVEIEKEEVTYNCVSFKTKMSYEIAADT